MKPIMIQGATSGCGKTTLVAGLCRLFSDRGVRVAPFKSQNMSLNSWVTVAGEEIARATAVQARGARAEPIVDMNPILLKPKSDCVSQLIIHGKVVRDVTAQEYFLSRDLQQLKMDAISSSLARLSSRFELIIAEGAGSCAEPNLRELDVVNMGLATELDASVYVAADIDAGGVFAHFLGILRVIELTEPRDIDRISGFVINKWRGDRSVLQPAVDFLAQECRIPITGVVPFVPNLLLEEEDRLRARTCDTREIQIALVYLPHISNSTDFELLSREPNVEVRPVKNAAEIIAPDAIVIPGTKNTTWDLDYLRRTGIEQRILELVGATPIFGVCGGFEMLGRELRDPHKLESELGTVRGMNLLPFSVHFDAEKLIRRRRYAPTTENPLLHDAEIDGYEIHSGRLMDASLTPLFKSEAGYDGAVDKGRLILGTFIHDLFRDAQFARSFVNWLRLRKGLAAIDAPLQRPDDDADKSLSHLARVIEANWSI